MSTASSKSSGLTAGSPASGSGEITHISSSSSIIQKAGRSLSKRKSLFKRPNFERKDSLLEKANVITSTENEKTASLPAASKAISRESKTFNKVIESKAASKYPHRSASFGISHIPTFLPSVDNISKKSVAPKASFSKSGDDLDDIIIEDNQESLDEVIGTHYNKSDETSVSKGLPSSSSYYFSIGNKTGSAFGNLPSRPIAPNFSPLQSRVDEIDRVTSGQDKVNIIAPNLYQAGKRKSRMSWIQKFFGLLPEPLQGKPVKTINKAEVMAVIEDFQNILNCYKPNTSQESEPLSPDNVFGNSIDSGDSVKVIVEDSDEVKWRKVAHWLDTIGKKCCHAGSQVDVHQAFNDIVKSSTTTSTSTISRMTVTPNDRTDDGNSISDSLNIPIRNRHNSDVYRHFSQSTFDFNSHPSLCESDNSSPILYSRRLADKRRARKDQWKKDVRQLLANRRKTPQPDDYARFQSEVKNILKNSVSIESVALLYYLTGKLLRNYLQDNNLSVTYHDYPELLSSDANWNSYLQLRIDCSVRYFKDNLAEWVAASGGFQHLLTNTVDSDVD